MGFLYNLVLLLEFIHTTPFLNQLFNFITARYLILSFNHITPPAPVDCVNSKSQSHIFIPTVKFQNTNDNVGLGDRFHLFLEHCSTNSEHTR